MLALARFAWAVLAYNVAVIGWGAYVRATGSGAGCGNHWPLCNGDVLPRDPGVATLIEFSHRLTSGVALVAVLVLLVWTFRATPRGHASRRLASWSAIFIAGEAAVGAGLVLFELVADNASMARAMFMVVHLLNTFFLLGALTLTAWSLARGAGQPVVVEGRHVLITAAGCAGLLLAGASGAVAALGDTLFPARSLAEALAADLSPASHILLRLRVLHPLAAVLAAAAVVMIAWRLARGRHPAAARLARAVSGLAALQLALGVANVVLLAPVWLQLAHLLVADALWIAFVLLGVEAASVAAELAPAGRSPRPRELGMRA